MNPNKLCFIICSNDEEKLSEALFYIHKLPIPSGIDTEFRIIRDARSMCEGYNRAMKSSDAKYKVYLHHDVWIIHENFIGDLISIFESHPKTGLLGLAGASKAVPSGIYVTHFDYGAVAGPMIFQAEIPPVEDSCFPCVALDGYLLATQVDLPWSEDIFHHFDFYDIAQTMNFRRAGYETACITQAKGPWCYHYTESSNLYNYFAELLTFRKNYPEAFTEEDESVVQAREAFISYRRQHDQDMSDFHSYIESLVNVEHKPSEALSLILQYRKAISMHFQLKQLKKIAFVTEEERKRGIQLGQGFWKTEDEVTDLLHRWDRMVSDLIRTEYKKDRTQIVSDLSSSYFTSLEIAAASVLLIQDWEPWLAELMQVCKELKRPALFDEIRILTKEILGNFLEENPDGSY